jgi:CDP-glucose 4,6-dehydratase
MPHKFWKNKKVLITGHTGFKGVWLSLWLKLWEAEVIGYSIDIPTKPSLYGLTKPDVRTIWADVRNLQKLQKTMSQVKPDIVFHLAAQPLVRASYLNSIETFQTNVIGTANVLEALRGSTAKAVVIVTTDKVYDNKEDGRSFKETDPLGGHDPYSASKGAAEIIIASYRNSFFNAKDYGRKHSTLIASARAGNVIGGGDFGQDRLVPDVVRAILAKKRLMLRYPRAVRPWQHVLEPLSGYLLLAEKLYAGKKECAGAWNFGPRASDVKPVEWVVEELCARWGSPKIHSAAKAKQAHEAQYLKLHIGKARTLLGWKPRWSITKALDKTVEWTKVFRDRGDLGQICRQQIKQYSQGLS